MSTPPNISAEDKIAALRIARAKVEKFGNSVCVALPNSRAGFRLAEYIHEQLGPHTFLNEWLAANRPGLPNTFETRKAYRLAWIDWMIACLEEDIAARRPFIHDNRFALCA